MIRKFGLAASLLLTASAYSQPAAAPSGNLYADPRIQSWSSQFLQGHKEEVLRSVEQDLRSAAPHPFAAYVWVSVQESLGGAADAPPAVTDPGLRQALGELPEVHWMLNRGQYRALITKYPASRAAEFRDPWALNDLAWAADYEFHYDDAMVFALRLLQLYPMNFRAAWTALDIAQNKESARSRLLDATRPGQGLGDTPSGRFLYGLLQLRNPGSLDKLAAIEQWLKAVGPDARALRFQADLVKSREEYEQAQKLYADTIQVLPFPLLISEQAQCRIHRRLFDEARDVVRRLTALEEPPNRVAAKTESNYAGALVSAGEKGEARKVLEAAIAKYADDPDLQAGFANLELNSNRAREAVRYARRAAELRPNDVADQERLVEVLRTAGDAQGAVRAAEEFDARSPQKSNGFYYEFAAALRTLDRLPDCVRTYERAVAQYPDSTQMTDNLAFFTDLAGKPAEALGILRKVFDIRPPDDWAVAKLKALHEKLGPGKAEAEQKAQTELDALAKRYPDNEALWDEQESRAKDDVAKITVWRAAIAANPGRNWPWSKAIWIEINSQRWDEAEQLSKSAMAAVAKTGPEDVSDAAWDHAQILLKRIEKERLPQRTLEDALQRLDAYGKNGLKAAYFLNRAPALEAFGRKDEAAQEYLKGVVLRPNSLSNEWHLVTKYSGELGQGRTMGQFQRFVDMDPYDGERLSELVHLKVMWYVNPPSALQWLAIIKERAPDHYSASYEADAWGRMGDAARKYRAEWSNATSIANSDRYLSWFDIDRKEAQGERLAVQIDPKDPLIYEVTYPDGQVVRRKQHPISGKQMLLQVGAAKVEAVYDENGDNLTRVFDSAGNDVRLTYYPDNNIRDLITSSGTKITFTYNKNKKPVTITLENVGSIRVTYKPDGEIDNVDSDSGREIALQ